MGKLFYTKVFLVTFCISFICSYSYNNLFVKKEVFTVPVIFAADNAYVPILSVALESLAEHASNQNYYHIYILSDKITQENIIKLTRQMSYHPHIILKVLPVDTVLEAYKLPTYAHFTRATYARIFISDMFKEYEKAIYLDCDVVVLTDLAELYKIDLDDNLAGMVLAYPALAPSRFKDGNERYFAQTLGLINPQEYFNAGVVLMNLHQMREENTSMQLVEKITGGRDYKWLDQDILNQVFSGRVKNLDFEWNVLNLLKDANLLNDFEESVRNNLIYGFQNPKIMHYNGSKKALSKKNQQTKHFWDYARKTPFYEILKTKYR